MNHRTGKLASFACDVVLQRDGRFSIRVGNRYMIINTDFKKNAAYATFDDGTKGVFGLDIDDDYDIRLSGTEDYEFVFRMPADLRASVIEAAEEDHVPPSRRRGTLSDTPFRF